MMHQPHCYGDFYTVLTTSPLSPVNMGHAYLLVEAEDKANTKEEVKSSEEIQNYFTNIRTTLFNIYKNSTEVPPTSYCSCINDSN